MMYVCWSGTEGGGAHNQHSSTIHPSIHPSIQHHHKHINENKREQRTVQSPIFVWVAVQSPIQQKTKKTQQQRNKPNNTQCGALPLFNTHKNIFLGSQFVRKTQSRQHAHAQPS